jgi:hypothetical protein
MSRRRSPSRSRRSLLVVLTLVGVLAGCAPAPSPDPQLVALQEQALSLTRSAQLGEDLRGEGRMFTTTTTALLSGMEQKLADVTRDTALHRPADAVDAAYRDELLAASLAALDAVQSAAAGDPGATDELDAAAERLDRLGDGS